MGKISNIISWVNTGTKNEVFLKRVLVICLALLILYKLGYAIGTFLAHVGM